MAVGHHGSGHTTQLTYAASWVYLTELYEKIGFFNREFKLPTWFDEGLAMQVDYRSYYSIDSLRIKSDNFKRLLDVTKLKSYSHFGNGKREDVVLNYSAAKYGVAKWYTHKKLKAFVPEINNGHDVINSLKKLKVTACKPLPHAR